MTRLGAYGARAQDAEGAAEVLDAIWEGLQAFWNFQITRMDGQAITVGKIASALAIFIVAIWISRLLSRVLGGRILRKFGANEGAIGAFQTIFFYVLVAIFAMLTLELVNVPLTVFTLLGGAIAIGVGFGSQNLLNNFISGLILLAERPIRIGDLIQVGDLFGTVASVGARSTRVRTSANVDLLVPNSAFLEQNVINWTLSDNKVRTHVTVGVVYGSPTDAVRDLMIQAAEEHPRVLKDPPPHVIFADFGDNALVFEVYFWLEMKTQMQRKIVESDIRFRIDAVCREKDIVIAFPQRDVHLDTVKPLDIRLWNDRETPS